MFYLSFIWIDFHLTSPPVSHISCRLPSTSCRTKSLKNTANSRSFRKMFDRTSVSNDPGDNLIFYLDIYFWLCQGLFEILPKLHVLLFPMCFFTLFSLRNYVDQNSIFKIQIASAHIYHSYSSIYYTTLYIDAFSLLIKRLMKPFKVKGEFQLYWYWLLILYGMSMDTYYLNYYMFCMS